jgi:DNA polymerase-1
MTPVQRLKAELGGECRACWTVEQGNKLVGIDASGLELRMLAHYMKDEGYINTILDGDIHSANQAAAGLETRDQAKTFIYAFLYGAGDEKIGSIAGKGAKHGKKLKKDFLDNIPSLKALKELVEKIAGTGSLPSLDGRRIRIRKAYSALNFLLQGGGAALMKKALLNGVESLREQNIPFKMVANVHDEFQVETPEAFAKAVGLHFRNAIRKAGDDFELRCPMDGEYKIGNNWSETH